MVSMKLTKTESKADTIEAQEMKGPVYPWGLSIQLEREALKKLKLSDHQFEVGDEIEIKCMAKVTTVSERETVMDEDPEKCVNLQITDMECKPEGEMSKTARKAYKEK